MFFLNLFSLLCHSCILWVSVHYYSSLSFAISQLFLLTGLVLPVTVVLLSVLECSLAFSALFLITWKWSFVLPIRICILLIALFLFGYTLLEDREDSPIHYDRFRQVMEHYSDDAKMKASVDLVQMKYKCCGSNNYTEWYQIRWYEGKMKPSDTILLEKPAPTTDSNGTKLRDDVPFSCCSDILPLPCIHFGVGRPHPLLNYTPGKDLTIWRDGCVKPLLESAQRVCTHLSQCLIIIILIQVIQCFITFNQYVEDQKSTVKEEIANVNVTGDEVQTDASLPRVNDKKKAAEPDLVERVPDMKDADLPVLDINIAKKEVTFNEKENAIIDSSNIWNNSKKLYPKIYEKKLPEKKDDLIKSILNRRKDTNRADKVHIDTDQENEIDERDTNIRETLKELKNKIFKKLENQRKYYLKHRSHNTGHYERPFGYLSTKLRKLHPSQRKKGAKTWSNLISSNVQALKDKYNRKISSVDEEEDRVIVMDGGGKKKEDKRDKYFSSSSTTDESPSHDETARSKISVNTTGDELFKKELQISSKVNKNRTNSKPFVKQGAQKKHKAVKFPRYPSPSASTFSSLSNMST